MIDVLCYPVRWNVLDNGKDGDILLNCSSISLSLLVGDLLILADFKM